MARAKQAEIEEEQEDAPKRGLLRRLVGWTVRQFLRLTAFLALIILILRFIAPPFTPLMMMETNRLGEVRQEWVPLDAINPRMSRAVAAAEDARFCNHGGFDGVAIRQAIEDGSGRGASTITQQVAKNVFLWPGRSWLRKGAEAYLTILIELIWPKARIMEIYLNVAEMGEGVFGVEAAAQYWFGVSASELSERQAAQLAAILPAPKSRSARQSSQRAARIVDGGRTLAANGGAACFGG
ncbi:monofunctional biosynthetic peptidoglycan transglycosylase [Paracoccaceae bacterium GXU_MW_L88]